MPTGLSIDKLRVIEAAIVTEITVVAPARRVVARPIARRAVIACLACLAPDWNSWETLLALRDHRFGQFALATDPAGGAVALPTHAVSVETLRIRRARGVADGNLDVRGTGRACTVVCEVVRCAGAVIARPARVAIASAVGSAVK